MEAATLTNNVGTATRGGSASPLLRLQSDERLVALTRRGNQGAFEVLVGRYQSKLLGFCRHMLGNREDAEDVLQEAFAAAYTAMIADDRPIMVKPWLYRIARNRSLNHMRRAKPVGVDSMDIHVSEFGMTTADRAQNRDEFRSLMGDISMLPETQRTALVLREVDGLGYEQIAEAMDTTVPSVKSLLVRARVALAEMNEARGLTCEEVRIELGEVAEGLTRRITPPVRRHLKSCDRCKEFKATLTATDAALGAFGPIGAIIALKDSIVSQLGFGGGSTAAAGSGSGLAGSSIVGSGASGSIAGTISAGATTIATKAAAGLAAAAIVTAGASTQVRSVPLAQGALPEAPSLTKAVDATIPVAVKAAAAHEKAAPLASAASAAGPEVPAAAITDPTVIAPPSPAPVADPAPAPSDTVVSTDTTTIPTDPGTGGASPGSDSGTPVSEPDVGGATPSDTPGWDSSEATTGPSDSAPADTGTSGTGTPADTPAS